MAEQGEKRVFKKNRFKGKVFTLRVLLTDGTTEDVLVHEGVLKETSGFFQAAVKKEWQKDGDRIIDLSEDEPQAVSTYIEWLYTDNILPQSDQRPKTGIEHGKHNHDLASLYVFGEKIQDDLFCDAIITAWTQHLDKKVEGSFYFFNAHSIEAIFGGTSTNSPARRFIVEVYAQHGNVEWLQDHKSVLQNVPDFWQDLLMELFTRNSKVTLHEPAGDIYKRRMKWFKTKPGEV